MNPDGQALDTPPALPGSPVAPLQLGETRTVTRLIPGVPQWFRDAARVLIERGDARDDTAITFRNLDPEGWHGVAADHAGMARARVVQACHGNADNARDISAALTTYAARLHDAQDSAREAIDLWHHDDTNTNRADPIITEHRVRAGEILDQARATLARDTAELCRALDTIDTNIHAVIARATGQTTAPTTPAARGTTGGAGSAAPTRPARSAGPVVPAPRGPVAVPAARPPADVVTAMPAVVPAVPAPRPTDDNTTLRSRIRSALNPTTNPDPAPAPDPAPTIVPAPRPGPGDASTGRVVIIEPGDTLSQTAEDHLGDARRWPELADRNTGVPQPDGRTLTDPDLIYPGWEIDLGDPGSPDAATPTLDDTAPDSSAPDSSAPGGTGAGPSGSPHDHPPAPPAPTPHHGPDPAPAPDPAPVAPPDPGGATADHPPAIPEDPTPHNDDPTTPDPAPTNPPLDTATPDPTPRPAPWPPGNGPAAPDPWPDTSTPDTTQSPDTIPVANNEPEDPETGQDVNGFDLGEGLFIGVGVAAAVSGALLWSRLRRDAAYSPGSGTRQREPLEPPQIRRLHAAYHRRTTANRAPAPGRAAPPRPMPPHRPRPPAADRSYPPPPIPPASPTRSPGPAGVVDPPSPSHPVPAPGRIGAALRGLDTARSEPARSPLLVVIGSAGDGADAALPLTSGAVVAIDGPASDDVTRALLLTLLVDPAYTSRAHVVLSAAHARALLGEPEPDRDQDARDRATIVGNLDNWLDAPNLDHPADTDPAHTGSGHRGSGEPGDVLHVVFLAAPAPMSYTAALLQRPATARERIAVIVTGRWRGASRTITVDSPGMVTANTGTLTIPVGSRLYTANAAHARQVLTTVGTGSPHPDAAPPTTTATPPTAQPDPTPTPTPDTATATAADPTDTTTTAETADPAITTPTRPDASSATEERNPDQTEPPPTEGPAIVRGSVRLTVFGTFGLVWTDENGTKHDITPKIAPLRREIIAYLAAHPDGVRRDTLIDDVWGEDNLGDPGRGFATMTSRIREALTNATGGAISNLIVSPGNTIYRINPTVASCDYWDFRRAITARAHATAENRDDLYREILRLYPAPFAPDIESAWIIPIRQDAARDATDTAYRLAKNLELADPDQAIAVLENATNTFARYNEGLYREVATIQRDNNRSSDARRTIAVLVERLKEIQTQPADPRTIELMRVLAGRSAD